MKKAGIYTPYWDTLGGGEKYVAGMARVLVAKGYAVELLWRDATILTQIEQRYQYDLAGVGVNTSGVRAFSAGGLLDRFRLTRGYEVFILVSDGSLPLLFAKNNIVHFQVPFASPNKKPVVDRVKKRLIDKVVCNSYFTKQVIEQSYNLDAVVVYPPAAMIDSRSEPASGKGTRCKSGTVPPL